jgi:hypothetical protein
MLAILGIFIENLYFMHAFGNQWWILTVVALTLVVLPTAYSILCSNDRKQNLLLILLSAWFIYTIYPLYAKDFSYVPPVDATYHVQVVSSIVNENNVPLGRGEGFAYVYSYYPGMHIFVAIISSILGVNSALVLKAMPMVYILLPFAIYLCSKLIFKSERIAQIAATVYAYTPLVAPSPHYSFYGLIFFVFSLYCSFLLCQRKKSKYLLPIIIFVMALSITHHITLYILVALMTFLYFTRLFSKYFTKTEGRSYSTQFFLLLVVLGSIWPSLVALSITTDHTEKAIQWLSLGGIHEPFIPPLPPVRSMSENLFVISSLLSILFLGFLGLLSSIKRKDYDRHFLSVSIFFAFLFVFSYISRMSVLMANRNWLYLFIAVAPFAGYFINLKLLYFQLLNLRAFSRIKAKAVTIIFLSLILCLSLSTVDVMPQVYYNFEWEDQFGILSVMREYGETIFSSVKWYILHIDTNNFALADESVVNLAGHFNFSAAKIRTNIFGKWPYNKMISYYDLYSKPSENHHLLGQYVARYLFVNRLASAYSEGKFEGFRYVLVEPVDTSNLDYLASALPHVNPIYSNGMIHILASRD